MRPMIHRLRGTAAAAAALGIAVALVACSRPAPRQSGPPSAPPGLRIDHAAHMDKGLECANCHIENAVPGAKTEPRLPTYAACKECHDEEDEKKPEAKKIKNLFFRPDGMPAWQSSIVPYDPEIRFTHAAHAKQECKACHGAMADDQRVAGPMFSMETCVACHLQKGGSDQCQACHAEIRKDRAPGTHQHLWKQRHGQMARSREQLVEGRCDLCHDRPTFCDACHRDVSQKPASHTNLWRIKTHGIMASIDRKQCMVCHQTDYCVRCHQETAPMSHRGGWVTGPQRHCVECHFPIGRKDQSCGVCHKQNPEHPTAPDQPPSHVPGMNCRACHSPPGLGGAPVTPHPDNGTSCERCHH